MSTGTFCCPKVHFLTTGHTNCTGWPSTPKDKEFIDGSEGSKSTQLNKQVATANHMPIPASPVSGNHVTMNFRRSDKIKSQ